MEVVTFSGAENCKILLLISCLAVVIDKAVQMAKARHQQELEDYFQLRQRALQN